MTVRPRLHALLVALLLGALCSFAVACGQDRQGLISSSRAQQLKQQLDAVDRFVATGQCDAVRDRLRALRREINDLPSTVDRDLRQRLREGLQTLEQQAPQECSTGTETTPTVTTPTETTPTETTPTETTPTETTPPATQPAPETTPPATQPAPETTPQQTQTAPQTGQPSGGQEAPTGAVVEQP